jgi:predicted secreted protein
VPRRRPALGERFQARAATAAIGEGGTQVFHLNTEHAGRFDLHFEFKRPWESAPIQTRMIDVEAR